MFGQDAQLNSPPRCRRPLLARPLAVIAVLAMTLALTGCGRMSGTYQAEGESGDKLEFRGGKVYITILPAPTMAGEYEVDGDKVILKVSGESMALTLKGNTLEGGPFGMKFVRK